MKKIFYIALALSTSFLMQSCEPMEDIYAEIDAKTTDPTGIKDIELRLTSVEYKLIDKVPGAGNTVKNNAFISEDSAKVLIPEILAKKYLYLGEKASVNVTYDLGNKNTGVSAPILYTVTDAVYETVTGGTRFKNFNSEAQILSGVRVMHTNPKQADLVRITYVWSATSALRTSDAVYLDGVWHLAYTLVASDYTTMEQGFANFSNTATAASYLPKFLELKFPFKTSEGLIQTVIYEYSRSVNGNRISTPELLILKYVSGKWIINNGTNDATLKFSKTKGVWVADNTIKYTITTDEHKTIIGPLVTDAVAKASILQYGNFDLKFFTSTPDIMNYLGLFLKAKFPQAQVGQKYLLTYRTHNPSGNALAWLILGEDGNYTVVEE